MAGWLLWMVAHPSTLWQSYLALLPAESDMTCLLNFSQAEAEALQVPELRVSPALLSLKLITSIHELRWCVCA
jgi:hypothetical protein